MDSSFKICIERKWEYKVLFVSFNQKNQGEVSESQAKTAGHADDIWTFIDLEQCTMRFKAPY